MSPEFLLRDAEDLFVREGFVSGANAVEQLTQEPQPELAASTEAPAVLLGHSRTKFAMMGATLASKPTMLSWPASWTSATDPLVAVNAAEMSLAPMPTRSRYAARRWTA